MLSQDIFIETLKHTPLVSIDLIVRSANHELLMGKRLNEPASGYWFVPGGRIFKSETLEAAFHRICRAELGLTYRLGDSQLVGAFTHLYPNNFAQVPGVSTHYVVLAYRLNLDIEIQQLPRQQHSDYRWFKQDDNLTEVHPYSQAYFGYLS
ncbi:GDP-mannose mannosyl hydrolase [Methylomonas sp. LL1]|uniref:GDP-mannose mannosyl hydrolase n=1 Tax=Methylomonas sp. LL1 TaxID=2785785 RepID=UPI0018C356C9|nr:GDP-mannose mannosyl hydrolase [Methylomonas sp. LL1]QPK65374.1 GDP-mannose mannosyl hydrolase [Methylomonas sp. LL1]